MISDEKPQYWFNLISGEVEEGPNSLAIDRLGPFDTASEATRALEIIRDRARAIRQEEDQSWRDGQS